MAIMKLPAAASAAHESAFPACHNVQMLMLSVPCAKTQLRPVRKATDNCNEIIDPYAQLL